MNILFSNEIKRFKSSDDLNEKNLICEKIIEYLKSKKICIYGGGASGSTLTAALKEHSITPYLIIDRKYDIIKEVLGCKAAPPESLSEVNVENSVVIIAINAEVIRNINSETYSNIEKYAKDIDLIEIGADITSILNFTKCAEKLKNGCQFNLVNCLECGAETRNCDIYKQYLKNIAHTPSVRNKNLSKKFDWFGYIMGQFCTLKCKHCCEHVPYLKNKAFSEPDVILSDCKKLAQSSEFIRYIELIGGEPFMHPKLAEVIRGLLDIENIGYVKIFTNGTVVPDEEMIELLKNPRVVLNFSNYEGQVDGKLAENIQTFRKILADEKIDYIFSESKIWTDWGGFELRNKPQDVLENDFENCFIANCHRVYNGKLYRCPHQYAGIMLGYIDYIDGEYVDINNTPSEELGNSLDMFEMIKYTEACKRCDMPFSCPEVPAAIQL